MENFYLNSNIGNIVISRKFSKEITNLITNNGFTLKIPFICPKGYKHLSTVNIQSYNCVCSCSYQSDEIDGTNIYVYPLTSSDIASIEATILFIKDM